MRVFFEVWNSLVSPKLSWLMSDVDPVRDRLTIASDEDGETMFVLVDDAAPTIEVVELGWRAAAQQEWGIEYADYDDEEGPDIVRGWYKPDSENDEQIISCALDDPDRSEEWWRFELPMEVRRV